MARLKDLECVFIAGVPHVVLTEEMCHATHSRGGPFQVAVTNGGCGSPSLSDQRS